MIPGMRSVARPGFRRRRSAPVWGTLSKLVIFGIVGAGTLLIVLLFQPEISRLNEMESNHQQLVEERDKQQLENLRLEREKELLLNDPEYLENIARDKLDLMKPGETIFRLDRRPVATEPAASP